MKIKGSFEEKFSSFNMLELLVLMATSNNLFYPDACLKKHQQSWERRTGNNWWFSFWQTNQEEVRNQSGSSQEPIRKQSGTNQEEVRDQSGSRSWNKSKPEPEEAFCSDFIWYFLHEMNPPEILFLFYSVSQKIFCCFFNDFCSFLLQLLLLLLSLINSANK